MSRGLRNNNPGNIRRSRVRYKGEVHPSRDPEFKEFSSVAYGYRAMFVLLDTYRSRYGLTTIRQMLNRYAPPEENFTEGYIRYVADYSGVLPDETVDTRDERDMIPIVAAMSKIENGVAALRDDVERGWALFVGEN
ncbi:MAG: structural protein P5 [Alistipes sp.]|nr:structural protein P5 [Alistipes sp.]